jgi:hypothetical protein
VKLEQLVMKKNVVLREQYMKRLIILTLLIVSITLTACNVKSEVDPSIAIKFSASELSDDEYDSIGREGLENPTKADFRNIEFTLDVKNFDEITDRSISVPDLKQVVMSNASDRYWFGSSSQQDNSEENFAHYEYRFVLYTKGLEEQGIRDIFKSEEVRISYTDKNEVYQEEVFLLNEILQLK